MEANRADELLVAISSDVETMQTQLQSKIAARTKVVASADSILEAMKRGTDQAKLDSLLLTLGSVFVYFEWHPVNHTYVQALG